MNVWDDPFLPSWLRETPTNVDEANEYARNFIRGTSGHKMMLSPAQWDAFEKAGLDMTLFGKIQRVPAMPSSHMLTKPPRMET